MRSGEIGRGTGLYHAEGAVEYAPRPGTREVLEPGSVLIFTRTRLNNRGLVLRAKSGGKGYGADFVRIGSSPFAIATIEGVDPGDYNKLLLHPDEDITGIIGVISVISGEETGVYLPLLRK